MGLRQVALPFEEPVENVIQNILTTTTIPTYSQFVPQTREATVDLRHLKQVDSKLGIYLLPESLTMTPVMSVTDVHLPVETNRGMYGDISTPFGVSRSIQGVLVHQAYSMVIGAARSEPTFEYLGENRVRLYGFPRTHVTIQVSCEHDENGESIPSTCYDSFMRLATLDTKIFLYNNLKLYDSISTAWGQINLKTDDYQGADAERTSLLDEWGNVYHLDAAWAWEYM